LQLRRIAAYLGLESPSPGAKGGAQTSAKAGSSPSSNAASPATAEDAAFMAAQMGMPVFQGRPKDPMLDLIDDL
jgi:hypothetical protein